MVPSIALDLGAGGGVPGLVLALAWSESNWVFIDARERSTNFLSVACADLGIGQRVRIHRGRAEELARDSALRHSFQVVTARGFAPPGTTAECASGFLVKDGYLLVSEPPEESDRWSSQGLAELGMRRVSPNSGSVAVVRQLEICDDRFPRRSGIPRKRPLF